jgi:transglutaminase-like putative cysteine protease
MRIGTPACRNWRCFRMAKTPSPLLDRRSRIWCLAGALACALPLLLLIPGWLATSLLLAGGFSVALTWKRPAPTVLRLLLTLGVIGLVLSAYGFRFGRDTASALLLSMLVLKPIELNNLRDARSLAGFGLFALFAAFLIDQGPLTLALAVPAAALTFAGCARLADLEVGAIAATTNWKRLATIIGLFALAIPLALSGFWLFPRLGSPMWGVPDIARARIGIGDNMAPGDWLDIFADDNPAFRVRFDGPMPAQHELYWRGLVMWNFDGRAWTQPDWPRGLAPAPLVARGRPMDYQIELEPTDRHYLFALDVPQAAPDGAILAEDRSMTSVLPVSSLRSYTLMSVTPARFEADLSPQIRAVALRLPPGFDPRAIALARKWRSETSDDAAIVRRALEMYHAGFSYSLAAPPLGRDSVDEFLFDTKIGFCEHFSSSFTFLMRAAGIPARVVTGYVGGYRNRIGDYWLVRQSDAHAWSEVWLRGRGWTRVDPTAAVAPERVFREAAQNDAGPGGAASAGNLIDVGDWLRHGWNDFVLRFNAAQQKSLLASFGLPKTDGNGPTLVFAIVSGALLALIALYQLRDRGVRADPLTRAWNIFIARLARSRLRKLPHEPAIAFARRIAANLPEQREEVLSLAARFAAARYARDAMDEDERRELIRALRKFRAQA